MKEHKNESYYQELSDFISGTNAFSPHELVAWGLDSLSCRQGINVAPLGDGASPLQ